MPTQDYRNAKGERVSGNTTIINTNLGWSKGGLMHWAWQQGKDGKDFRESRDAAADAGTVCHAMVEATVKLKEHALIPAGLDKEIIAKAEAGYLNFLEWRDMVKLDLRDMEVPCISEEWQFGTTVDLV